MLCLNKELQTRSERRMTVEARLLLVEDDAPFRRSLETFLRRAGYIFDSCATAREALELSRETVYAVAVVEYRLPDADGSQLICELRSLQPQIRAVFITVYDHDAMVSESPDDAYLKKPFDPVELESVLNAFRKTDQLIPNAEVRVDFPSIRQGYARPPVLG